MKVVAGVQLTTLERAGSIDRRDSTGVARLGGSGCVGRLLAASRPCLAMSLGGIPPQPPSFQRLGFACTTYPCGGVAVAKHLTLEGPRYLIQPHSHSKTTTETSTTTSPAGIE